MKPEWGTKHECPSCGAHFYDMRKPDASCPKCGTPVNDEATLAAKTAEVDDPPPAAELEADDLLEEFDDVDGDLSVSEDDDDFMEDADDLVGSDETDMSEIFEHVDEPVVDQNL
ncbi:FYDLN acid domain-containing protein [Terasakiella sp. A23]|uniref:FYDLN acid domain-containing protein n=1 Tax=Terasakiella sp. FCG-A23 TaxID=3080561 RepID=UPI002953F839|nr:FYDLN acid domain-containing protein [Terasakiella sp. A23]MDV7339935.1 FYDLN acid domain-containing protein [Terasakiella sp. A23]